MKVLRPVAQGLPAWLMMTVTFARGADVYQVHCAVERGAPENFRAGRKCHYVTRPDIKEHAAGAGRHAPTAWTSPRTSTSRDRRIRAARRR
jgi:hypothetical protein